VDTVGDSKRITRRRHSAELKQQVLAECEVAGASVARVAMAHGLNANLVHKWRRLAGRGVSAPVASNIASAFLPVPLPAVQAQASNDICIELRRGSIAVNVTWPLACSAECAAWLREILR
jgi:transposase